MKKAIKINISGLIFHIDEDAYEKLKSYLKTVELYFSRKDEGREIIDDIESRIAELFQTRVTEKKKEVITIEDVNEVTGIMGDPSEFLEEAGEMPGEPEQPEEGAKRSRRTVRSARRLYRDPDNAVLGGVCGGLGAYFGIDPVIIRILFVILFFIGHGVWAIVYIVLWIAIPKAVSIAQRLEMRGERVTVSNIEKTVKQEYEDVKANWKNIEKTEGYRQARSSVEEILHVIGRIFVVIAKIVLILVGVALVFAGFILLMSFLGVFFFQSTIFSLGWFSGSFFPLSQFLSAFVEPVNMTVFLAALFLVIIIPLISIIYTGIKMTFRISARDSGLGIVALILWIAGISVLFTLGFIESRKYAFRGIYQENMTITAPPSKTLYLQVDEAVDMTRLEDLFKFRSHMGWRTHHAHGPVRGIYVDQEGETFWSRPSLSIRHTNLSEPELSVVKTARGPGQLAAELNAERVSYNWELRDSVLIFSNLFTTEPEKPWNFGGVSLRLSLPEGYSVKLGEGTDRIITSASNTKGIGIQSMTGKRWVMTKEGLAPG